MTKKEIISLTYINELPKKLGEILDNFKGSHSQSLNNAELLKKILSVKEEYAKNGVLSDSEIEIKSLEHASNGRAVFLDAYIGYMGLAFHYNAVDKNDAAWFYYAKAQKNLGSYESWDKVLDYLAVEADGRAKKAHAGKVKHQKTNKILIDAFVDIINKPPNKEGWSSKKELIDKALPELDKMHREENISSPLYENLEDFLRRQLNHNTEAAKAFSNNYNDKSD